MIRLKFPWKNNFLRKSRQKFNCRENRNPTPFSAFIPKPNNLISSFSNTSLHTFFQFIHRFSFSLTSLLWSHALVAMAVSYLFLPVLYSLFFSCCFFHCCQRRNYPVTMYIYTCLFIISIFSLSPLVFRSIDFGQDLKENQVSWICGSVMWFFPDWFSICWVIGCLSYQDISNWTGIEVLFICLCMCAGVIFR